MMPPVDGDLPSVGVELVPREPPLSPQAAVVEGEPALHAARTWARHPRLDRWSGVAVPARAGGPLLCILGEALPWAPGVGYFAADPAAPDLLLPTHRVPSVPVDWLRDALVRGQSVPGPFLLRELGHRMVSLSGARRIEPERLVAWATRG